MGRYLGPVTQLAQFFLAQTDYVFPHIVLTHENQVGPTFLQRSLYSGLLEFSLKVLQAEFSGLVLNYVLTRPQDVVAIGEPFDTRINPCIGIGFPRAEI